MAGVVGVAVLAAFYLVPNALESWPLAGASPLMVIFFGDAVGCLALTFVSRRIALWLYLGLSAGEAAILSLGLFDTAGLVWVTDLVPAVVLGVLAAAAVVAD